MNGPQDNKMNKPNMKYWKMKKSELAAATREFDEESIAGNARPMNAAERAEEKRARRRGRSEFIALALAAPSDKAAVIDIPYANDMLSVRDSPIKYRYDCGP
jgi:hypothetical protein